MKTTNVILVGVLGVGAVGAYMYMKNNKAENALLSDSLPAPATSQGGATPPLATTPLIPTPNLTEPVKISGDANLDAYNLQKTLDQLKSLDERYKKNPYPERIKKNIAWGGFPNPEWEGWNYNKKYQYPKQRAIIVEKLAKLGYKFDNGLLIKI